MNRRPLIALGLLVWLASASADGITQGDHLTPAVLDAGRDILILNPWRFRTGDSPVWSDPDYDDNEWETTTSSLDRAA